MARRIIGPIIAGVVGTALLLALGVWQVQRLTWKRNLLSEIEAQIGAPAVALPDDPDPDRDRWLSVTATGRVLPEALRVMTTDQGGAAFRVISPFRTGGREILLDRGVVPADAAAPPPPVGEIAVTGNLYWSDAVDIFTPAPDLDQNLWYVRDTGSMAAALGTEPVLLVAREVPGDAVSPRPIDTVGIRNHHLGYAVTWFSLAAIWAGMTVVLVWRIRRRIG